jgi:FMN reductase
MDTSTAPDPMHIVSISGSPRSPSRAAWLLHAAEKRLADHATSVRRITLRELPAQTLVRADTHDPSIRGALNLVARADLVIIATPIYHAAYSGLLKLFLDLLPHDALRGKTVLALASGSSPGHLLALDYTLKPVLAALGARHILDALYATDKHLVDHPTQDYVPDAELGERLDRLLQGIELPPPDTGRTPNERRTHPIAY